MPPEEGSGEVQGDLRRRLFGNAREHAQPLRDIQTARATERGRQDERGSVGEEKGDLGRQSSVYAHEHAQPRLDVRRSREDGGGGHDPLGGAGE